MRLVASVRHYTDRSRFDLYSNHLLVIFAFFLPFSKEGYEFVLSLLILLFLFGGGYKEKLLRAFSNRVVQAFLLYYALFFIGLIWSSAPKEGLTYIHELRYFLLPLLFLTFLRHEFVSRVITAFLFGMLVNEIYSYGMFFGVFGPTKWGDTGNPTPFVNHLNYSMMLAFTSLMVFQRLLLEKRLSLHEKILHVVFFVTVTSNLFITGGRSGQLVFVLGFVLLMALIYRKNIIRMLLTSVIILSVVLSLAYNYSTTFKKRIQLAQKDIKKFERGRYATSWGYRVVADIVLFDLFWENPVLGVGTSDHMAAFRAHMKENFPKYAKIKKHFPQLHNQYFIVGIQFGLVGLVVMFNLFYQIYRYRQPDRILKNMQYLLIFMTLLYSLWNRSLEGHVYFVVFIALIAITLSRDDEIQQPDGEIAAGQKFIFLKYAATALLFLLVARASWIYGTHGDFRKLMGLE